jgi:hypothetical protein
MYCADRKAMLSGKLHDLLDISRIRSVLRGKLFAGLMLPVTHAKFAEVLHERTKRLGLCGESYNNCYLGDLVRICRRYRASSWSVGYLTVRYRNKVFRRRHGMYLLFHCVALVV